MKTIEGEITVTVPGDDDMEEDQDFSAAGPKMVDQRQSLQVQAKLAEIGMAMGFKIWLPRSDRGRVWELIPGVLQDVFLEDLP